MRFALFRWFAVLAIAGALAGIRVAPVQASPYPIFQTDCGNFLPPFVAQFVPGGLSNPRLECWLMTVPENYERPNRSVWISFYRVRSAQPNPAPDPIFYLPGGPGGAGYFSLSFFFRSNLGLASNRDFQGRRDLILIDPRGNLPRRTAVGNPISECPEAYRAVFEIYGSADGAVDREYPLWSRGLSDCLARLRAEGWDLNQYHTRTIVRDMEEIRIALGYSSINLFSESYGTLHALHYMRTYPGRVRVSVLDSVTPPDTSYESRPGLVDPALASLNAVLQLCESDRREGGCNARYPRFRASTLNLLSRLDQSPYVTSVVNDYTGAAQTVYFNGRRMMGLLVGALYRPDLIESLPLAVRQMEEQNNFALVEQFKFKIQSYADGGFGMKAATVCSDFGRMGVLNDRAEVNALPFRFQHYGLVANVPCEAVGVGAAPPSFNQPVASSAFTLVLAGKLDPITPWQDSRDAAARLSRSLFVAFERQAHVPVRRSACAQTLAMDFFDWPRLSSTCAGEEPPLNWR